MPPRAAARPSPRDRARRSRRAESRAARATHCAVDDLPGRRRTVDRDDDVPRSAQSSHGDASRGRVQKSGIRHRDAVAVVDLDLVPRQARRARRTPSRADDRRASRRGRAAAFASRRCACRRAALGVRADRAQIRDDGGDAIALLHAQLGGAGDHRLAVGARARHASSGSSSIIDGTIVVADANRRASDARPNDDVGDPFPATRGARARTRRSRPSARERLERTRCASRSRTHPSSVSSPPSASAASPAKNAADDGSPGTTVSSARDARVRRRELDACAAPNDVDAARAEHALGVIARSRRLARPSRARRRRSAGEQDGALHLRARDLAAATRCRAALRRERSSASPPCGGSSTRAPIASSGFATRRIGRRLRLASPTNVAVIGSAGDDAGHEPRRRAAVAAVEIVRRRAQRRADRRPSTTMSCRQRRNVRAERAQHAGRGVHVGRLEDAGDARRAVAERGEDQRAMRDRLVARDAQRAADLHLDSPPSPLARRARSRARSQIVPQRAASLAPRAPRASWRTFASSARSASTVAAGRAARESAATCRDELIASRVVSRAPGPAASPACIVRRSAAIGECAPSAVDASCGRWLIHAIDVVVLARGRVLDARAPAMLHNNSASGSLLRVRALLDEHGRLAKEIGARAPRSRSCDFRPADACRSDALPPRASLRSASRALQTASVQDRCTRWRGAEHFARHRGRCASSGTAMSTRPTSRTASSSVARDGNAGLLGRRRESRGARAEAAHRGAACFRVVSATDPPMHAEADDRDVGVASRRDHRSHASSVVARSVFSSRYFTMTGVCSESPAPRPTAPRTRRAPGTTTAPAGISSGRSASPR